MLFPTSSESRSQFTEPQQATECVAVICFILVHGLLNKSATAT